MGLGELVSSLFAINTDAERQRHQKRILFSRRKKAQDGSPDISQTTAVSEGEPESTAIVIDPRMHFAMSVSRNIERCVFKLMSAQSRFEQSREYFRARDREYDEEQTEEISCSGDYHEIVQFLVDEACGEAFVFIEKNKAGRLRVYAQFRRNEDDAVGQFSSDMPSFTDITNCYKAGDVTFGRIKREM
ncbi:MAG: hypothetical protein IJ172_00595 [Ruminococcus sp.]|nr:hypothetical protein [Ruminococcus sp.]